MRILSWVQNKFNSKEEQNMKYDACSSENSRRSSGIEAQQGESTGWPNAFLAIGTMGKCSLKDEEQRHNSHPSENSETGDDSPDITIEEVTKLQKELTKLLTRKRKSTEIRVDDGANLPLDQFLNCPSSLEVDRTGNSKPEATDSADDGDLSPNSKLIVSKVKEMLVGNRDTIKKKSASLLFQKMFVCASGFTPSPSLRNSIPESRIEKILKAILTKRVHPQNSAAASKKRLLKKKKEGSEKRKGVEEKDEKKENCKWVKTDSEYIVLEM